MANDDRLAPLVLKVGVSFPGFHPDSTFNYIIKIAQLKIPIGYDRYIRSELSFGFPSNICPLSDRILSFLIKISDRKSYRNFGLNNGIGCYREG